MYVEQCDFNGNVLHHNRCKWNTAVVQLSSVLIDSVECGDSVATSRVFSGHRIFYTFDIGLVICETKVGAYKARRAIID